MSTYSGRNGKITVNASTSEAIVTELGNWDISMSASEVDTTAFGDGWGKSDVGMKSYSGSMSGFCDPEDTAGQKVLEAAFLSGDLLADIRFYTKHATTVGEKVMYHAPDTASDPNAGVRITAFNVKQDKSGVATLSVSFSGSGPILQKTETLV